MIVLSSAAITQNNGNGYGYLREGWNKYCIQKPNSHMHVTENT